MSSVAREEICFLEPDIECTACATLNRSFPSSSVFASGHLRTAGYGRISTNTKQIRKIRKLSSLPLKQKDGRSIAEKVGILNIKAEPSIEEATAKPSKLTK